MPTTASRRYLAEFGSAMAAYVVVVVISAAVVRAHPDAGWRYAVVVAPRMPLVRVLPILVALWGVGVAVSRRRYR